MCDPTQKQGLDHIEQRQFQAKKRDPLRYQGTPSGDDHPASDGLFQIIMSLRGTAGALVEAYFISEKEMR